jgi:phenylpropionate dioxygenase-like ring-hydroxylating dioxygenase large terminal subunit
MDAWAESLFDEAAFAQEQERLAHVWTFLGLTGVLAQDDAWITGRIGGRPVFVQRFGDHLRGFENICAHRQFPLRLGEAGCGPVVCGFHHWRYDDQGRAVGVPIAQDAYGCSAEALGAALAPIEVATCGQLVFGRFAGAAAGGDLADWLGEAYPILAAVSAGDGGVIHSFGRPVAANWKLMTQITLDDYHTPAVHGRKRYQRRDEFDYWRIGPHSAHCVGHDDTLAAMTAACAEGRYRPSRYKIFNIFPNLAVSLFEAGPSWYAMIQRFDAEAPGLTRWRSLYFRTPWRTRPPLWGERLAREGVDRLVAIFIRREAGRITEEDHLACERLQSAARQAKAPQRLSAHEARVGWFYEAWRAATGL